MISHLMSYCLVLSCLDEVIDVSLVQYVENEFIYLTFVTLFFVNMLSRKNRFRQGYVQ